MPDINISLNIVLQIFLLKKPNVFFSYMFPADPSDSVRMRLVWKSLDKMRCLRKRSTIPFLGFLITFLLFLNLYIEDGYVLEGDKRQLREASVHPPSSERYAHTFRDLSNFSGTINVTYRYLAGTPLNRK
ncbi:Alpha-1,3-mannosyl-glycoprotein 4-beta-N-acetylglucosaminyltransferase C, partial [Ameca splendens]